MALAMHLEDLTLAIPGASARMCARVHNTGVHNTGGLDGGLDGG
ncbi:MAG: hypothetical protein ACK5SX_02190 [Sandaracinobacter sp.]